jgi:hypothetical protein
LVFRVIGSIYRLLGSFLGDGGCLAIVGSLGLPLLVPGVFCGQLRGLVVVSSRFVLQILEGGVKGRESFIVLRYVVEIVVVLFGFDYHVRFRVFIIVVNVIIVLKRWNGKVWIIIHVIVGTGCDLRLVLIIWVIQEAIASAEVFQDGVSGDSRHRNVEGIGIMLLHVLGVILVLVLRGMVGRLGWLDMFLLVSSVLLLLPLLGPFILADHHQTQSVLQRHGCTA